MSSNGLSRFGGLLVVALMVVGCVPPAASTTASMAPTASVLPSEAAAVSPEPSLPSTPEPTVEPTPAPTEPPPTEEPPPPIDPDCPQDDADDVISVQEFVDGKTSCFKNGIRVRGWLDTPPPIGFEPPLVKPSWIYYPSGDVAAMLWHQPPPEPDHVCSNGTDCWAFFPHLDPTIVGLALEPLDSWVILTGHTRDPRAQNCHYDGVGPNPNPELVDICVRQFVVTAIEEAP